MRLFRSPPFLLFPWGDEAASGRAPPPTDETLLEESLSGSEASFEKLVRRYHAPLARFLRLFVSDPIKAEDAAQETWIALLENRAAYEGRSSFKTWLFRVGANRARDLSRKEGRDETRAHRWAQMAEEDQDEIPASRFLPSTHPQYPEHWGELPRAAAQPASERPDQELLRKEAARRISEELARLPEAMAAMVTLRDFAAVSSEEAAELLNLSEAHGRVLLHRGRLRLWKVWEKYQAGEE